MAKKTVGYINLEWICPNCSNRNPGPQKTCLSCGAAQPADVKFVLPEKQTLINEGTDQASGKLGADIHCPFCGARNTASSEICSQCGGDLKEGLKRASGEVLGAFKNAPEKEINCPACGNVNPADQLKCTHCGAPLKISPKPEPQAQSKAPKQKMSPFVIGCGVFLVLGVLIGSFLLFGRREDITGQVSGVKWERGVQIEEFGPVSKEAWIDEVPAEGRNLRCETRLRNSSDAYVSGAEEVCGTPYVVDSGTGQGEVAQDCVYNIYDDYCDYEIDEWKEGSPEILSGSDYNPIWPSPQLSNKQRAGDQFASYTILFTVDGETYSYKTTDESLFFASKPGTRWTLTINPSLNSVISIEPAQ